MEVVILSPRQPSVDLINYDSATSSPNRIASPSTPSRFRCFFSTPTSPTSSSSSFHHFSTSPTTTSGGSPSTIPKLKLKIPKPKDQTMDEDEDDFQFDFTGQLQKTSLPAADELFHRGIIKTLKPPPPLPSGLDNPIKSQPLPINTKSWRESAPLRSKKYDFEKLAAAVEQSRNSLEKRNKNREGRERGREKASNLGASIRKQRGTRSQSPFSCKKNSNSSASNNSKDSLSKKWNLRDLWLKKSNKEELKRYSVLKKSSGGEDMKESSFRSTESGGGGGGSERRRGAAERQYAAARAAAEEMRRKTVLPYKHGLLGCMGFSLDPTVHEISRGIGSLTRG